MITRNANIRQTSSGWLSLHLHSNLVLLVLFSLFFATNSLAQDQQEYDEIPIYAEIQRLGGFEIPSVIKGNDLYLAITDLFDFVKVRNLASAGLDSITGFFINPEAIYIINYRTNRIKFQERIYTIIPGDLIRTESNLYLKSDYFGRIFGLDCNFNFRALTVTIISKLELPVIREMRLEEMRRNVTRIKGEVRADTSIGATRPLFRFGMADWGVYADEEINGRPNTSVNIGLGAMIAGGEATANLY